MLRISCLIVAVVAIATGHVLAGETLESVEKKIVEQWEKHRSVSASFAMTQNMETSGMKADSTSEGTYEYMKDGERHLYRMDMTTTMVQDLGGQTMKSLSKIMMIDDGEFQYTLAEVQQLNEPMVIKAKSNPTKINGCGKAMFDSLHKQYDLKLMPDKTVSGKSVYVIQGTPKATSSAPRGGFFYYFRKDIGMPVKIVYLDKDGKTVQTMTYSDIKLNAKIDRNRFVFKAPDGAQFKDTTERD